MAIDGGRLSAILDFEVAAPDARALDLAAGLNFTLRPLAGEDRWHLSVALLRGYGQHQRLTSHEIAALPQLILLRELASRVWWLGRGMIAGNVGEHVDRLAGLAALVGWIEANGERLSALATEAMMGDPL